jgi:peptide deformylase
MIEESAQTDEQYEGCRSFFNVRGMVPRPLDIHVEHQDADGSTRITHVQRGMARLVARVRHPLTRPSDRPRQG